MKNSDGCDDHRDDETCDCALVASIVAENMPKATTKRRLTHGESLIAAIKALGLYDVDCPVIHRPRKDGRFI